ncbi:MAG: hypothetical protein ACLR56_11940 [Oscillospiraceae bacterium]
MKRPEYVAAATAAAYAARDKGCVPKDIEDLLKNVFHARALPMAIIPKI